jgi:hypothetical protein
MKNRYFILSILFWAIASVCLAIKLPASPFISEYAYADSDNESYVSSIGTQIMNHAMLSAYNGECDEYREGGKLWQGDVNGCTDCCDLYFPSGVDREGRAKCYDMCDTPLGMPLGTTLCLAPFALAYAGFMFYRRRKENAEQA